MPTYRKRTYTSMGELISDLSYVFSRRGVIRKAMREDLISPTFRERLMTVVTEVNDCRYCRSFHQNQALKVGISRDELSTINSGYIPTDAPEREVPALQYAQHWAEKNAHPDASHVEKLHRAYRESEVEAIHVILYMIRIGNLLGNTFDFLLYKVSCGRWGQPQSS